MVLQWHALECGYAHNSEGMKAFATVPSGSPWFDGHFPDEPLLPGIAMIGMAFDFAQQIEARNGTQIRLNALKRIRFKKPVRPNEPITMLLKREQREVDIAYNFTVLLHGEAACIGSLTVERVAEHD